MLKQSTYPMEKFMLSQNSSRLEENSDGGCEEIGISDSEFFTVMRNKSPTFSCKTFKSPHNSTSQIFRAKQVSPCFPWMPGPTLVPMEDEVIVKKVDQFSNANFLFKIHCWYPEFLQDAYYHVWVSNEKSWWRTLEVQILVETE